MERARKSLEQTRTLLSSIAHGEVDATSLANAAIWYMRAVGAIEKIRPERMQEVRGYALMHHSSPSDELTLTLTEAQGIIGTLREGSRLKRCDFERVDSPWLPSGLAPHHPGLRDAVRLLQADAARLIPVNDPAGTVDRCAVCLRIGAHL